MSSCCCPSIDKKFLDNDRYRVKCGDQSVSVFVLQLVLSARTPNLFRGIMDRHFTALIGADIGTITPSCMISD